MQIQFIINFLNGCFIGECFQFEIQGSKVGLDLIRRRLKIGTYLFLTRIFKQIHVFAGLLCLLLAWHGARFVHYEWLDGGLLFGTVPAWACELIIPLAFALMGLRYLLGLGAPPSEDRP